MSEIGVGLAQLSVPPGDAGAARRRSVEAAEALFRRGARIVVLPEMCVPWYTDDRAALAQLAEPLDGPTVQAWQATAAAHDGMIVGGFCERAATEDADTGSDTGAATADGSGHGSDTADGSGQGSETDDRSDTGAADGGGRGVVLYNSAVAVTGSGVVGHYRKLHLFATEKHCFEPGDLGLEAFDTPFGRLGICVCYDLRFVEVVRVLALTGADLICVPTAWVRGFDRRGSADAAPALIPHAQGALVQANLSQVFIACASQAGGHGNLQFLGSSIIAGPDGRLVAGPLATDAADSTLAHVDLAEAQAAQVRSPLIRPRLDRRTDVYGVTLGSRHL